MGVLLSEAELHGKEADFPVCETKGGAEMPKKELALLSRRDRTRLRGGRLELSRALREFVLARLVDNGAGVGPVPCGAPVAGFT